MVETARELAGVFPVPVPRPFGLIAAGARNELQFSKNSLRVKYARLVLTQLVKLALKRFDAIHRLGDEPAVRTDICRSRPQAFS
jgi:hypothetical protein